METDARTTEELMCLDDIKRLAENGSAAGQFSLGYLHFIRAYSEEFHSCYGDQKKQRFEARAYRKNMKAGSGLYLSQEADKIEQEGRESPAKLPHNFDRSSSDEEEHSEHSTSSEENKQEIKVDEPEEEAANVRISAGPHGKPDEDPSTPTGANTNRYAPRKTAGSSYKCKKKGSARKKLEERERKVKVYCSAQQTAETKSEQPFSSFYSSIRISSEEASYSSAAHWFQMAAEQNSAGALKQLGFMWDEGVFFEQNKQKAKEYYWKAAQLGHVMAMYCLGELHAHLGREEMEKEKQNPTKNKKSAIMLEDKVEEEEGIEDDKEQGESGPHVDEDSPPETQMMAVLEDLTNNKHYRRAFQWYTKAASLGDTGSVHALGFMYDEGQGVPQDKLKAFHWYMKSARLGKKESMCNVGYLYDVGEGVDVDKPQAIKWYLRAAERDSCVAMRNLGILYDSGDGVDQDKSVAAHWYLKSSKYGDRIAMRRLAVLYHYGDGVDKSEEQSMVWYQKAAELGDLGAVIAMAKANYHRAQKESDTVQRARSYTNAAKWFHKALEVIEKLENASNDQLDIVHTSLDNVVEEMNKKCFNEADAETAFALGVMYKNGTCGVPQSDSEALRCFEVASLGPHSEAARLMRKERVPYCWHILRLLLIANKEGQEAKKKTEVREVAGESDTLRREERQDSTPSGTSPLATFGKLPVELVRVVMIFFLSNPFSLRENADNGATK